MNFILYFTSAAETLTQNIIVTTEMLQTKKQLVNHNYLHKSGSKHPRLPSTYNNFFFSIPQKNDTVL